MKDFNIPVVLFIYQRFETVLNNLQILKKINARKIYILSDYSLEKEKKERCDLSRSKIESAIDWDCEVIKIYAKENIGVHKNIGIGAISVFEKEREAIFLEDDCLANETFFYYCQELLEKYKDDEKVIWINGTNYYGKMKLQNNESYGFHQQLLPCGWASWSNKFLKHYDFNLDTLVSIKDIKKIKKNYCDKALYFYQKKQILLEFERKLKGERYNSWDYHMIYSIMNDNLYGICPKYNLITNTGVDNVSQHISKNKKDIMVKRFHWVPNYDLEFPLIHPKNICKNKYLDKKIDKKILPPLRLRFKSFLCVVLKKLLGQKLYLTLLRKNGK